MWGNILISVGLIVFLVGYWFLPLSYGEKECNPVPASQERNFGGGIAGVVIGLLLLIIGFVMNFMNRAQEV